MFHRIIKSLSTIVSKLTPSEEALQEKARIERENLFVPSK